MIPEDRLYLKLPLTNGQDSGSLAATGLDLCCFIIHSEFM